MNLQTMLKVKQAWDSLCSNHPKLPEFLIALKRKKIVEGTDILIDLTYPDGSHIKGGIKVKQGDLELLQMLKSLNPKDFK